MCNIRGINHTVANCFIDSSIDHRIIVLVSDINTNTVQSLRQIAKVEHPRLSATISCKFLGFDNLIIYIACSSHVMTLAMMPQAKTYCFIDGCRDNALLVLVGNFHFDLMQPFEHI